MEKREKWTEEGTGKKWMVEGREATAKTIDGGEGREKWVEEGGREDRGWMEGKDKRNGLVER